MNDNHSQALHHKHAGIDEMIHQEETRPAPDAARIATLKKQKLRIKEALLLH